MSLLFPLSIKVCLLLPLPLACLLLSFIVVWTLHFCLFGCSKERESERATEAARHVSLCLPFHCLIALLLLPRHSRLPFRALSVCSLSIPLLLLGHSIHSLLLLLCRFCSLRTPLCPHSQRLAQPVPALSLTLFLTYLLSLSLSLSLSRSLSPSLSNSLYSPVCFFHCLLPWTRWKRNKRAPLMFLFMSLLKSKMVSCVCERVGGLLLSSKKSQKSWLVSHISHAYIFCHLFSVFYIQYIFGALFFFGKKGLAQKKC